MYSRNAYNMQFQQNLHAAGAPVHCSTPNVSSMGMCSPHNFSIDGIQKHQVSIATTVCLLNVTKCAQDCEDSIVFWADIRYNIKRVCQITRKMMLMYQVQTVQIYTNPATVPVHMDSANAHMRRKTAMEVASLALSDTHSWHSLSICAQKSAECYEQNANHTEYKVLSQWVNTAGIVASSYVGTLFKGVIEAIRRPGAFEVTKMELVRKICSVHWCSIATFNQSSIDRVLDVILNFVWILAELCLALCLLPVCVMCMMYNGSINSMYWGTSPPISAFIWALNFHEIVIICVLWFLMFAHLAMQYQKFKENGTAVHAKVYVHFYKSVMKLCIRAILCCTPLLLALLAESMFGEIVAIIMFLSSCVAVLLNCCRSGK